MSAMENKARGQNKSHITEGFMYLTFILKAVGSNFLLLCYAKRGHELWRMDRKGLL